MKQRPELRNDATLMRLSLTDISFGLAFLPAALWASPYDGVYKQTANAECALVGVDGGSLKIEENIFYGVEVECHMINPVEVEDMNATIYEMQCSGEGEAWTERAMLMPDAQGTGLYMIWSGYAFRYDRCEAPVR
ncbi:hypothetical protein [Loktanella sp. PT4BL]|uniref:hypothetical protein n=1 Tax=Loktanella sp. PT4BL TaxID=2135611 RepID=UPI002570BC29|nr:hypothetical protein [Loktanella sp. PT4BL]